MKLWHLALIGALSLLGCGGEGGDVTVAGGSCPTCSSAPSVTNACAQERTLASGPTKGPSATTTTTTTTTGTPFSAPPITNVNVNTPPSSSVSISCGGGSTTTP